VTSLESLLQEATARLDSLRAAAADAEALARSTMIEVEKAAAYVDGLRAAQSVVPTIRVRTRQVEVQNARSRELSNPWKQILHTVSKRADGGTFDYEDLDRAAREVGHESSRETLRSQMSLYKGRGLVDAAGGGAFALTQDGHDAIADVVLPKVEPVAHRSAFGRGSSFTDDLDDDVPF